MSITIADNTFTNNQIAIRLAGDPLSNPGRLRLTADIRGNIIKGFGPSLGLNRAIVVSCGVSGDITENLVSEIAATSGSTVAAVDFDFQSDGRFVPVQPLNFERNTFINNRLHLFLSGKDSRVVNNTFSGHFPGGFRGGGLQVSGTNILVASNNFSDMPTGVLFIGTEPFGGDSPPLPPASNPSLLGNSFCNVPEPIRVNPLITVLQEKGTETNCPFAPRFQSIVSGKGDITASLRGWHGDSYFVETSTNLQNWAPVNTNLMTFSLVDFLSLVDLLDTRARASLQASYRALNQE